MSVNMKNSINGNCYVCLEDKTLLDHDMHPENGACETCLDDLFKAALENNRPPKCPLCQANITHLRGTPIDLVLLLRAATEIVRTHNQMMNKMNATLRRSS